MICECKNNMYETAMWAVAIVYFPPISVVSIQNLAKASYKISIFNKINVNINW